MEYQIGDWVRFLPPLEREITKVLEITEHGVVLEEYDTDKYLIPYEYIEPWKPKKGEYVWDSYYGLLRVIKQNITGDFECQKLFQKEYIEIVNVILVEPFIGELPSFI